MLKVAPRVQGKILEAPNGKRFIVVEQKGRDIWRGKHKTLHEAAEAGDAQIGVDRILLQRCQNYDVSSVMIIFEELRRVYFGSVEQFFDEERSRSRANWQGRSTRLVGTQFLLHHYLGPDLKRKRKRASAS